MTPRRPNRLKSAAAYTAAVLALGLVSLWYLSPALALDLATRVWSCFG